MSADFSVSVNFQPDADTPMNARGYLYAGQAWASVRTGTISIAAPAADFEHLIRLADALKAAVAQARQAQQDADLADLVVTE